MRFTYGPGDRPLDGFTIKRPLGRGGFGEVYQAVSDGGKIVALKHVQRHLDVEIRGVAQCLNVKSPHLVEIIDIKQTPGEDYWIVMENMDGDSLDRVVSRHPHGMPEELALTWLVGLCEGLRSLHERGIVHRDMKPGNVFMGQGVVKLGDYGLSKFISNSRRSGHTGSIGTVHYMAPEVAQGRYGKEIDLYSIGIMLFEMLTGKLPFDGETAGEILMKHLTAAPDLSPLPARYQAVIGRLLEKDPTRRYSSVDAMMADIGFSRDSVPYLGDNALPQGVPVLQAVEPTDEYREQAPSRRASRPRTWVLVLCSLVLALGTAGWSGMIVDSLFRGDDPAAAVAVGVGILTFFASLALLKTLVRRRGNALQGVLGRRAWVGSLPWYARLVLSLSCAVGLAMCLGAVLAEMRWSESGTLATTFVFGTMCWIACLVFFFGRPAPLPSRDLGPPRYPMVRPGAFAVFLRVIAVGVGVGLVVGGLLSALLRHEEVGVLIGIAAGLFACLVGGIYSQARVFTGLTVATLTAVAIGLFVGGVLSDVFRNEKPAAVAAVGIGLIVFTAVIVLWQRFLLQHVTRARFRAHSFFGRVFGSELQRARG